MLNPEESRTVFGMIPNTFVATLGSRFCGKCSVSSTEACPERGGGRMPQAGKAVREGDGKVSRTGVIRPGGSRVRSQDAGRLPVPEYWSGTPLGAHMSRRAALISERLLCMGSYSELRAGSFAVESTKGDIEPTLMALFVPSDKRTQPIGIQEWVDGMRGRGLEGFICPSAL